ncbi:Uncharacterised protein [Brevundimonas diminuta]|uniref:Uncharacterized protein n=1 Tax=Brevundimonas diminuta TaxID=293 RepID=A0A2X1AHB9_BREDI|nr:Uncharacterised protein [Brevundimonas diminuta]
MPHCRRRAMNDLANDAMRQNFGAVDLQVCISVRSAAERIQKAFIPLVLRGYFYEPAHRRAPLGNAGERIS